MVKNFKIEPLIKNKLPYNTKVVVAMSGGVDSSVVAVLLHKLGYKVIGITLQLYSNNYYHNNKSTCCSGQDIIDAKHVAETTGFPHFTLNYEEIFKKEVIDDFVNTYMNGQTPIPCIKCNQTVKFRDLLKVAKNLDADALATGHYVRRLEQNNKVKIYKGIDKDKDQSYFLFGTTKEQLNFLRFPLGSFYKKDIRKLAKHFGLSIFEKPDSQDICFVSEKYNKTINKLSLQSIKKGKIIDIYGNTLGEHNGIINFTVGQRKGLRIQNEEPLYVIKINKENNEIVVGPVTALIKKRILIRGINWLEKPKKGTKIIAKLRSSHTGSLGEIYPEDKEKNEAHVILDRGCFAISPGQACVIYKEEQIICGGWIYSAE